MKTADSYEAGGPRAMFTVNFHEGKTHLSRRVDRAAKGEPFIVAKAGRPLVKVVALDTPATPQRLGFLSGEILVPDDFDEFGEDELASLFTGAANAASEEQ